MAMKILLCWIGHADLAAAEGHEASNIGPIAQAIKAATYNHAIFLDNYRNERVAAFSQWLTSQTTTPIEIHSIALSSPTNHKEIYEGSRDLVRQITSRFPEADLTFHISPGTPAMALVWMLLAPASGARLIESSKEKGVQPVHFPFEIAAYFLPDRELTRLTRAAAAEDSAFNDILYRSEAMGRIVNQAHHIASRDVTVLIEGESGTGKELFARAIHRDSRRAKGPFVPVNCGAIPSELVESLLFGYKKGAFTNAAKDTAGYFQAADGGTLFLDELGELPQATQVKLLRVLEERAIMPVGGTEEEHIDVRIIAATNRNLLKEVATGRFRSDLFYRLAVGLISLPPLREKKEDLELLLDSALARANEELSRYGDRVDKKISDNTKKILTAHPWPGNVRELYNTIMRAALWSPGDIIDEETAKQALLALPVEAPSILNQAIGSDFSLKDTIGAVAAHYLERAMAEAGGVKARAARLLGFEKYQTLTNWLKRYGLE
ncbi:hypothetical protein FACS189460_0500 [Deltaproteobacteria bacterium]|nr:hypothetical protein FACS189460_0500 [Deltaproteobacteria bacterium]